MPAVLALPAFWGAVGAAGAGTAAIVGAHETSSATQDAAATTSAAANHAADLQAQAAQQSLVFQQAQSENAYQNNEASRQGNYGQWAAQQGRLKSVGEALGIPNAAGMEIPAYVPGVDPHMGSSVGNALVSPGSGAPASTPSASGNPTDPNAIAAQLQANYKALGVTPTGPGSGPTDLAYYAGKVAQTGGLTPQNIAYWFGPTGRIASDLGQANGGSGAPTSASSAGSVGSYLSNYMPVPMAPALSAPGSVGSYLG